MSISPLKPSHARPPIKVSPARQGSASDPLTISQALLITAGLAGLIGLGSGLAMRFSWAHSANVRFLSPLQTFPALEDWSPESPQVAGAGAADTGLESAAGNLRSAEFGGAESSFVETGDRSQAVDRLQTEPISPSKTNGFALEGSAHHNSVLPSEIDTFDGFAARDPENRQPVGDPWEALEKGLGLGAPASDIDGPNVERLGDDVERDRKLLAPESVEAPPGDFESRVDSFPEPAAHSWDAYEEMYPSEDFIADDSYYDIEGSNSPGNASGTAR